MTETKLKSTPTKTVVKSNTKFSWSMCLVFVLLIIIIGIGYFCYRQQQLLKYNSQSIILLRDKLNDIRGQLAQAQTNQQQLVSQQNELSKVIQKHGFSDTEWVLSNVLYLLQQAHFKLKIEHDVKAAIIMLKSANKRLQHSHSVGLRKLRMSIKNDIVVLQKIKIINLTNLSAQFSSVDEKIDQLMLLPFIKTKQKSKIPQQQKGWKHALEKSLQFLRSVIVVQKTDHTFKPLLDKQQLSNLQQYLHLLLQRALWGALNRNTAIYQYSLKQVQKTLQEYAFPSQQTQKMIVQLIELQKLDIAPILPNSLPSLIMAQQLQKKMQLKPLRKVK